MTFISYAQNFEDVMLFRALKGVEKGFYIDVGAQDPVLDSVTKMFYERGWRGINVEPVEQWFQKLVADRPEDINLRLAAWSQANNLRFFEVRDTGMSTADIDFAREHAAQGFEVREHEIPANSLDAICADFRVQEVHFLKVDVEGGEDEVLSGMSLISIRPWIILVEATEPNSRVTTHKKWEHLLTNRGYEFAYFDGLNRFYIAQEHGALKNSFSIPPNYFDHYIRYSEWSATQRASHLESEREALARESNGLRDRLEDTQHALRERVGRAEAERDMSAQESESLRVWLKETQREAAILQERVGRTEAEREAFAREAAILQERVGRTEAEREAFAREAAILQERVGRTEAEREAFAREAAILQERVGRTEAEREAFAREAAILQERVGRTEAEREAFAREAECVEGPTR